LKAIFEYWQDTVAISFDSEVIMPPERKPTDWAEAGQYLVAGGFSGIVSRTFTAPIERVKVLFQVNVGKNPHLWTAFSNIYKNEGILAYWRGNGANILKVTPEHAIRFLAFEMIKKEFNEDESQLKMYQRFMSGSMAGVISHVSTFPLEVIKTRLAATPRGVYQGIGDAIVKIYRNEGVFTFFRGMTPSILSTIPASGTNLAVYETLKIALMKFSNETEPSVKNLLICSTISSTIGHLISYPFHVFKARLIIQGAPGHPILYNGFFDVGAKVLKNEGLRGFYKGIVPTMMKSIPSNWATYLSYEFMKRFFGIEKKKKKHHD